MRYSKRYIETALRAIAAERPDALNPRTPGGTCMYNGPDGSHCIVGQFLANEGIEVPDQMEGWGAYRVFDRLGIGVDHDTERLLGTWQNLADGYMRWGEIVAGVSA